MSVTFFAIDRQGAIMPAMPELNVSNGHAVGIERELGFRPQVEEYVDIPGGERTVDEFQTALMINAVTGGGLGWYGQRLAELVHAAHQAGAEVIAWG